VFWPRANRYGAIASLVAGAVLGAVRFIFELNRSSDMVAGSPFLSTLVSINFLHFAVLIFGISAAILVVVSLATQPESVAKLRGLTFATLEGEYSPARERSVFTLQVAASVALVLLVTSLWIHFA
jgi:SSS family solute:Na+ symporter